MSTIYYEIGNKFSDKNIRLEFIRKINSLLLIQLSITFGWTFYANDGYDLILYGNVSNTTQIAQYLLKHNETATSTKPQMQSQEPPVARNRFKTNETASSTEPQMPSQERHLARKRLFWN